MSEKKYCDLFEAKKQLHRLLRRIVVATKIGIQERYPDDDIELDIGNGSINSCAKYGQVRYYPEGFCCEYELDEDLKIIKYLIKEINKRFQEFKAARDKNKLEYSKGKKKFAQKFFEQPLTKIIEEYET